MPQNHGVFCLAAARSVSTLALGLIECLHSGTNYRMVSDDLTLLSVFSGCGGLDLGLEQAGFRVVGCVEMDASACATLKANRPKWPTLEPGDVNALAKRIEPRDLGLRRRELSLLAGGPPCQPFSKAAQWSPNGRRGSQDKRASCLTGFLRLVEEFLPKVFLIENVPGFLSGRTSCLERINRTLSRINRRHRCRYRLCWRLVDAADYGVPQHRTRVIALAARDGREPCWPPETHKDRRVTAWDALRSLSPPAELPPPTGWLELLPTIPEGSNYIWHTRRGGGRPLFGYRTRYWSFLLKLATRRPSWTLPAQPGPYTGPFHWDNRPLTAEERLRLQSFPTTWRVAGRYCEVVRQIGNATPPLLAEVIGRAIASQFLGQCYHTDPRLRIPRSRRPSPEPAQLESLPKKYRELIGVYPDHPGPGRGPRPTGRAGGQHE